VNLETTSVYSEVSGLAAWSENCKWYSSLPLGAVVSLFYEPASWVLCCFSTSVCCLFRYDSVRKLLDTPPYVIFLSFRQSHFKFVCIGYRDFSLDAAVNVFGNVVDNAVSVFFLSVKW